MKVLFIALCTLLAFSTSEVQGYLETATIEPPELLHPDLLIKHRPNEYYTCGSACQTECATLGEPCPIINITCNWGWYCIDGYARDSNGICIPIRHCKKVKGQGYK